MRSQSFLNQCELVVYDIESNFDVKNVTTNETKIIFVNGANEFKLQYFEIAQIGRQKHAFKITKYDNNGIEKPSTYYYFIYEHSFVRAQRV